MHVQLPDGSQKEVPENATVADVAAAIGKGLAKAAIAGKIDGKVVDLSAKVPDGVRPTLPSISRRVRCGAESE